MPNFYEEEEFDLQRMPGSKRPASHTPARIDTTVHTPDKPFCYDPLCACHSNQEAIERVEQWIQDGLMTENEAYEYISGRIL